VVFSIVIYNHEGEKYKIRSYFESRDDYEQGVQNSLERTGGHSI